MKIQKFRTFEEAERALWNLRPDEKYYEKMIAFYDLFTKLSEFSYPKGIFKFKTLEEAEDHKMNSIINSALNKNKTRHE